MMGDMAGIIDTHTVWVRHDCATGETHWDDTVYVVVPDPWEE